MRTFARLCAALLVASFLSVVGGGGTAHAGYFVSRWCSASVSPCVESLFVAGTEIAPGGDVHLDFTDSLWAAGNGGQDLQFFLQGVTAGQAVRAEIDLGAYHPDKVFGLQQMSDVDVWKDSGSGHWMVRMTGSVIQHANGCSGGWPPSCPSAASSDQPLFEGDVVSGLPADLVGYYMGTNVMNNDISIATDSSGTPYLETEAWSPHYFSDNTTVVHGSMHFRLPYVMLRDDFGIPNPETMKASSLAGTVNGTTSTFVIAQDPDGGGIYVDVDGFTFTTRTIRVKTGTITPTRPTITAATRPAAHRGHLSHTLSTPRGAKVTGYVARCVAGDTTVTATGSATSHGISVYGLRSGVAYTCRVAATSKVGRSRWSVAATIPRH